MNIYQNRIYSMTQLRNHLDELYTLIGISPKKVAVPETNKIITLIETFQRNNALYTYLDALDAQSVRAIKKMKEINLELWNGKENEKQLDELEQKIELLEKKLCFVTDERDQLVHRCDQLQKLLIYAEEADRRLTHEVQQHQEYQHKIFRDMITLRDSLLLRLEWMRTNTPDEVNAAKLTESLLEETARLMQNIGLVVLLDTGVFNGQTQTIVDTIETDDEALYNHIAQTIRPGYRFEETMLRSQEVKVFVAKKGV